MKSWYSIKAQGDNVEIDIFDEIGFWGITAKDFINDLKRYPDAKNISLRINSYGGEVFDGVAIYNALKRHPANVTVVVYGIAASIASIIAMAGDKVIMPENTYMFVHDPLALVVGDADDMRDMADALDKIAAGLIASYVAKSGKDEKQVKKWMAEDTWFTAQEALDAGLADEVTSAVKIAANATLSRFKNLPEPLKPFASEDPEPSPEPEPDPAPAPDPAPEPDPAPAPAEDAAKAAAENAKQIVAECAKAGIPEAASEFLEKGLSAADVQARLADAPKIRARAAAAIGAGLKLDADRINAAIRAGKTVNEFADELFDLLLAKQGQDIDNKITPEGERRDTGKPKLQSAAQIYELRRKRK